jgi:hypothetical protein
MRVPGGTEASQSSRDQTQETGVKSTRPLLSVQCCVYDVTAKLLVVQLLRILKQPAKCIHPANVHWSTNVKKHSTTYYQYVQHINLFLLQMNVTKFRAFVGLVWFVGSEAGQRQRIFCTYLLFK